MKLPSLTLMFVTCLALAGCGVETNSEPANGSAGSGGGNSSGGGSGSGSGGSSAGGTGGTTTGSGGTGEGGATMQGAVGIVVIDVQETFVSGAKNPDIGSIIDRTKNVFQLAADQNVPFFITFEDSQQGDHALHAPLQPVLPGQAKTFIKTTFDATGLPAFGDAIKQSGLTHLVVLGSETDVCVLQTVLGLRNLGFKVLLEQDAVFTSETNTSPALRRMQQAGTLLVSLNDVSGFVAKPDALPKPPDAPVRIVHPMHMGVVLNDFNDAALAQSADPLTTEKGARLRELLLVSEWFDLPVYVSDVGAGLPSAYATYFKGSLRPITQIAQDGFVEQLVFAGTDGGLADTLTAWKSRELFVMEDAMLSLGTPAAQKEMLAPFFADGLVPATYKMFYYDMTKSVSLAEWPAAWVQKFDEFYWITQAPEDLPPIYGN